MITGMHNAVLQRLHPQVELPLARPYLDKFDKARLVYIYIIFIYIFMCVCLDGCQPVRPMCDDGGQALTSIPSSPLPLKTDHPRRTPNPNRRW